MGHSTLENKGHSAALSPGNNVRPLLTKAAARAAAKAELSLVQPAENGGFSMPSLFAGTKWASEIVPREVQWLWPGYIPRGRIGAVKGAPKGGKSTFLRAIIAALTTGQPFPGHNRGHPPMNTWWLTAEEDGCEDIVPNLALQGADMSRVLVTDTHADFGTQKGIDAFERVVRHFQMGFIVIDSLSSWVIDVDLNSQAASARWLQRFKEIASKYGCTIIFVRHDRKGATAGKVPEAEAAMGSQAIQAILRFELSIKVEKDGTRTLSRTAGNLGRAPEAREATLEGEGSHARWVWGGIAKPAPTRKSPHLHTLLRLIPTKNGIGEAELQEAYFATGISDSKPENRKRTFESLLDKAVAAERVLRSKGRVYLLTDKDGSLAPEPEWEEPS